MDGALGGRGRSAMSDRQFQKHVLRGSESATGALYRANGEDDDADESLHMEDQLGALQTTALQVLRENFSATA